MAWFALAGARSPRDRDSGAREHGLRGPAQHDRQDQAGGMSLDMQAKALNRRCCPSDRQAKSSSLQTNLYWISTPNMPMSTDLRMREAETLYQEGKLIEHQNARQNLLHGRYESPCFHPQTQSCCEDSERRHQRHYRRQSNLHPKRVESTGTATKPALDGA